MVGISFKRPVGPCADTKELEYISALHQSGILRQDGSIRAEDIQHYLSSRHGVRVSEEVISIAIIQELGGSLPIPDPIPQDDNHDPETGNSGGEEEEEKHQEPRQPVLDICQLTALLLIPLFRKGNANDDLLVNSQTKLDASNKDDNRDHYQAVVASALDVAMRNILAELKAHTNHPTDDENLGVLLTPQLLREVLEIFGEYDVPDSILGEMMNLAQVDQNNLNQKEVFFNRAAFLQALTADTQLYNPDKIDGRESTHFDDARKARDFQQLALYGKTKALRGRRASIQPQLTDKEGNAQALPFQTIYMASNIDNTADTYRSATWFTLVWFETVLVYFGYMLGKTISTHELLKDCPEEYDFGCSVAASLLSWTVIFFQLMLMGFTWVFMASLGNTTHPTETCFAKFSMSVRLLVGVGVVTFVTIVSFFTESQTQIWDTKKDDLTLPANWTAFIGGLLIISFQLMRLAGMYIPLGPFQAGGMEKKEKAIKAAASFKVLSMVEHAMLLHVSPATTLQSATASTVSAAVLDLSKSLHTSSTMNRGISDTKRAQDLHGTTNKALLNFHRMQDAREDTGGVIWFAKRAINQTLFEQEGIYLHGRLWAVNLVQFFICAIMVALCINVFQVIDDAVGEQNTGCTVTIGKDGVQLPSFDPFWNMTTADGFENIFNINATHFSLDPFGFSVFPGQMPKFNFNTSEYDLGTIQSPTLCWETYTINASGAFPNEAAVHNALVEALDIKEHEWKGALGMGLIGAFAAVLGIACVYMPSFTSSVLKLRSGFAPSLKGDYDTFGVHRKTPDHTSILFGTNFWGCLYTAGFMFFLVALATFLCVYSYTWPYVKHVLAILIGMGTTIAIKVIIMRLLRGKFYSAFYRKKPAASNIMNVILECWSLGLSIGVVTSRFIKLLIVTALYVGRVDTPMLAPGVGYVGPVPLDSAPNAFTIDLLSHEAHRHPFIERLGLLYLLKLYNGKNFGTRAGAYWRILFVLAFMPWMRNYRISSNKAVEDDEEEEEDDIMSVLRQSEREAERTDGYDIFNLQLEMDLTRRAYDRTRKRNKDLKSALILARDKVRELKQEKRELRRLLQRAERASSRGDSRMSSSEWSNTQDDEVYRRSYR